MNIVAGRIEPTKQRSRNRKGDTMPVLRQGSSGPDVTALQQKLKDLGFDPNGVDGNFGPGTKAAVIAFQQSKGLQADGVVGPATMAALQTAAADGATSGADVGGGVASGAAAGTGGATTGAGAAAAPATANMPNVSVQGVAKMFFGVTVATTTENLPF